MQAAVLDSVPTVPAPLTPWESLYPDFPDLAPPASATGDASPTFVIDSLSKADWAVYKILDAEARIARRAELAAELHARIDQWKAKADSPDGNTIAYLSALLRPFVESELASSRRSRSLLLPSGTASLRKLPDRLEITDAASAMAWAESHAPEAVIIEKKLSRAELKRLVLRQGEAIPGIEAELGHDELYVKATA